MIPALEELQTFCVGRLLIDLPKGTTVSSAHGSFGRAEYATTTPVSKRQFESKLDRRWLEIQARTETDSGKPLAAPATLERPVEDGALITFDHATTRFTWEGETRDWPIYETEAYLWRNDVLYSFRGKDVAGPIAETMQVLHPRADDAIPTGAGFCGARSFFAGGGYQAESVHVIFRLPGPSGLALIVETATSSDPDNLPSEPPRPDFSFFKSDDFDGVVHRDAQRTVDGREGSEWGMGTTQRRKAHYESSSFLRWFTPGKARSSEYPSITVTLEVSYETDQPPSPWGGFPIKSAANAIDEETFMAYWEVLLDTLRSRPGAV